MVKDSVTCANASIGTGEGVSIVLKCRCTQLLRVNHRLSTTRSYTRCTIDSICSPDDILSLPGSDYVEALAQINIVRNTVLNLHLQCLSEHFQPMWPLATPGIHQHSLCTSVSTPQVVVHMSIQSLPT